VRGGPGLLAFVVAARELALLMTCVGRAVENMGDQVSPALTGAVLPPLLLAALLLSAIVAVFVTFDGESTWYEGVVLIALYSLLAAAFWWG